jgi:hypothetical protein
VHAGWGQGGEATCTLACTAQVCQLVGAHTAAHCCWVTCGRRVRALPLQQQPQPVKPAAHHDMNPSVPACTPHPLATQCGLRVVLHVNLVVTSAFLARCHNCPFLLVTDYQDWKPAVTHKQVWWNENATRDTRVRGQSWDRDSLSLWRRVPLCLRCLAPTCPACYCQLVHSSALSAQRWFLVGPASSAVQ